MSIQDLLSTISERLASTASVKNVYGDPVVVGNRTVIPVASVRYAFGGGGGAKNGADALSGGGGGRLSAVPRGALEITENATRFVPFVEPRTVGVALAVGIAAGALIASLTMKKRVEIVKRAG